MLDAYLPLLLEGAIVTIELALCSVVFGIAGGLLLASASLSRIPLLSSAAFWFASLIRGLPELLILVTLYYGVGLLAAQLFAMELSVSPWTAGIIALSLTFAAYASETFRGAFQSVPSGLVEAAGSFGMKPLTTFRRVTFPLALRLALPGLGNLWLVLLKETALVSIVGLSDLMRNTKVAAEATTQPFTFFAICMAVYLMLSLISTLVISGLEHRCLPRLGARAR